MGRPLSRVTPIVNWLTEQIELGRFQVGQKIPSEYTLAERFGVNKTTANKAVAELVARGYLQRQRGAAGTRVSRSEVYPKGRLACLIPLGSSFPVSILRGIHRCAFTQGYEVVYQTIHQHDDYARLWRQIRQSGIDALLMMGHGGRPQEVELPCVYIDDHGDLGGPGGPGGQDASAHWVVNDNEHGSMLLAKALLDAGHRHFAYICNDETQPVQIRRRIGFERAIQESADQSPTLFYHHAPVHLPRENTRLWQALRQRRDITAIVFTNDLVMKPFIAWLNAQGHWPMPDKVLAGFGNMPELQSIFPCLTVEQYPEEVGFLACQRAIGLIQGHVAAKPGGLGRADGERQIIVHSQLVNEALAARPR